MTETVLVGLLSGVFGVLIAGIPTYFANRNAPSRKVSETASIVDSTGKVVTMYRAEIDRLDSELKEARDETQAARFEMKAIKDDLTRHPTRQELIDMVEALRKQLNERPTKEELMETVGELKGMVRKLEQTIDELKVQVRGLGGIPKNGT